MGGKQCLSILFGGAGSGYWIKKQFEEGPFARFCPAGFGSVYPPLDRLLNQRLISLEEVNQTGRAARKIDSITSAKRQFLTDEIPQKPASERLQYDFICIMFFEHMLPVRDIYELIGDWIVSFRERLAKMCQCGEGPIADGEKFAQGTTIAIYEAGTGFLKNHGHELIDAGLRNEAGAAGRPPCSAHISEA